MIAPAFRCSVKASSPYIVLVVMNSNSDQHRQAKLNRTANVFDVLGRVKFDKYNVEISGEVKFNKTNSSRRQLRLR